MYFRFLLYYIMKKRETHELDIEMVDLLENSNYTPYEEWKNDVQNITHYNKNDIENNEK